MQIQEAGVERRRRRRKRKKTDGRRERERERGPMIHADTGKENMKKYIYIKKKDEEVARNLTEEKEKLVQADIPGVRAITTKHNSKQPDRVYFQA